MHKFLKMARILTGIQSSGKPHLGNILGAIKPAIELSKKEENESYFFIADMHSLVSIKDSELRIENTNAVPVVCELTWYLNCFTPYPMLANAHSFKDKSDRLADVNAGLFDYPVLMAADILMYDADFVPVGKDQKQHLEITRDIASTFNHQYGETFVIPEPMIDDQVMTIPGTDGQKMSKSYNNIIDAFLPEKQLRKNVMQIVTDSTPIEEPKDPDTCNVFAIYQILASEEQTEQMRKNYLEGNYGYGHAKQELFELIRDRFKNERELYAHYIENPKELESKLQEGEKKAEVYASQVMDRVKKKLGFK